MCLHYQYLFPLSKWIWEFHPEHMVNFKTKNSPSGNCTHYLIFNFFCNKVKIKARFFKWTPPYSHVAPVHPSRSCTHFSGRLFLFAAFQPSYTFSALPSDIDGPLTSKEHERKNQSYDASHVLNYCWIHTHYNLHLFRKKQIQYMMRFTFQFFSIVALWWNIIVENTFTSHHATIVCITLSL